MTTGHLETRFSVDVDGRYHYDIMRDGVSVVHSIAFSIYDVCVRRAYDAMVLKSAEFQYDAHMVTRNEYAYADLDALLGELHRAETGAQHADICLREWNLYRQSAWHDDACSHVVAWHNHTTEMAMRAIEAVLYPAGFAVTMAWEKWYDYANTGEW